MKPNQKCFPTLLWVALWMLTVSAARAIDVQYFELFKGQIFTQSGTNGPTLPATSPYLFQTFVYPLGYPTIYEGDVTNPVIKTPAGISHPLRFFSQTNFTEASPSTNFFFNFSGADASQSALDTAYGEGTYTLSYTGLIDGAASAVVSLGTDAFPPAPPFVSNLVAAQSIDPSNNFTLSFGAWTSAETNEFVELTVLDSNENLVFATPPFFALYPQTPLSATNTGIVITNGTLKAGQIYTATLAYLEVTTNNSIDYTYPTIWGGFFSETVFALQTQGSSQTNNPPPPPPQLSPPTLTGAVLTLTISGGNGPFASAGAYQIFISATGSNYFILGDAGGGFGSGGYAYTPTGANTGTITFTDSKAGVVSLQVMFSTAGAGTFTLTGSSGTQEGAFTEAQAYTTLHVPNIFLPSYASNQFQAFLSGDPGVNYTVETSTNLTAWSTLTNLTVQNLSTSLVDDQSSVRRYYRARVNSIGFAPVAITGLSFSSTIMAGAPPFSSNGIFQFEAGTNGNDYLLLAGTGATNGAGTYTYTATGPSTAAISYKDSISGATCVEQLVFTSVATGYFYTTNVGAAGFQSGSFKMAAGPVLFLGNVRFTPDTARGASALFNPAGSTPLSLSVTDVVGNIWSLSIPADALLTQTTISMMPFASGIDSSQSTFPIFSGVQLGPEGTQFSDGVTLTLTTPSPLGPYATLLMGAGDGTGVLLVQTTNQGNSYSTTLFHFSTGVGSNPTPEQQQAYLDDLLKQAQAAFKEALAVVKNLTKQKVMPPEPPDDAHQCAGNPAADAQVDEYVSNLYSEENAAIGNLLSAARALILLGDQSDASDAFPSARQLVETVDFGKVNALFHDWSGSPLKFNAVAKAALTIARQDQLLGGPGLPDVLDQLATWLSGNVLAYYWDQLRNQDDYTLAPVLLGIEREIALLGGPENSTTFIQDIASAYTFNVTLTVSDIGDQFSIKAHGTVKVSGNPQLIFPIGIGANGENQLDDTFSYDSGSDVDCSLQLPLQFSEGAVFNLDCTNMPVNLFIYQEMGSFNEIWSCPSQSPQNLVTLILDFDDAFENTYGTLGITVDYDCSFVFPVQWQNLQAQPVNQTFTGPGEYAANDTVTFTIVVEHDPSSAPQTLTP